MEIVATIRKAHDGRVMKEVYQYLMNLGIYSFRFNFSKAEDSTEKSKEFVESFLSAREVSSKVSTILDIPYPGRKIRINSSFSSIDIVAGDKYYLCSNAEQRENGNKHILYLNAILPIESIYIGMSIVYDSGQGEFTITNIRSDGIVEIVAENSFTLYNLKSISFGYVEVKEYYQILDSLCEKLHPNKVALSFINSKDDLHEAIALKNKYGFSIISKIEAKKGIDNLSEIATISDGIMLGRGDLCLNSSPSRLIEYQLVASRVCREKQRELYFATDFLTSLSNSYMPKRSDIIDLQYAISLDPTGVILNVELVTSNGIERAVKFIRDCERTTKFIVC